MSAPAPQEYEVVIQRANREPETVLFYGCSKADVLYAAIEFYPSHVVRRVRSRTERRAHADGAADGHGAAR